MLRRLKKAAYKYAQQIERQVEEFLSDEEEEEELPPLSSSALHKQARREKCQNNPRRPVLKLMFFPHIPWTNKELLKAIMRVVLEDMDDEDSQIRRARLRMDGGQRLAPVWPCA
ncbi:hypothetical protein CRENBAI_019312 [Crenichthys baileyi]|uniref:Uncharacterized protein n=1 Tax=Crenichthys baileyi TaxID=28760 RepID=A0AAV9R0K6_9TELE